MRKKQEPKSVSTGRLFSPIDVRVARQVARIRTEKGLTQSALAKRCGFSSGYLSRVESSEAALTLTNLGKVAEAFGVPVEALLGEESFHAPLFLHRAGPGRPKLLRGNGSHAYEMLAAEKRGKLMEPLIVDVRSEASAAGLFAHAGEEFDYVLEGRCTFFYGKERIDLAAGDAVYYDASVPHGVRGTKGTRCRLLVVVSSKDYLFHGDIIRLLQNRAPSGRVPPEP